MYVLLISILSQCSHCRGFFAAHRHLARHTFVTFKFMNHWHSGDNPAVVLLIMTCSRVEVLFHEAHVLHGHPHEPPLNHRRPSINPRARSFRLDIYQHTRVGRPFTIHEGFGAARCKGYSTLVADLY